MKPRVTLLLSILCCLVLFIMPGFAADSGAITASSQDTSGTAEQDMVALRVPLFSPIFSSFPVAAVNDEFITLNDFKESIGSMHTDVAEGKTSARKDYSALLNRLITIRLILQEAKNIGLDELPEVEQAVKAYEQKILIELLQKQHVKDIKPDADKVEGVYRDLVKELKVKSVLFEKEHDAREFETRIKGGGDFDELIEKAIADGTARGEKGGAYFKNKDMLLQIARAAAGMKLASVSPVIHVGSGFALFKLEDVRYPDDPGAREQARLQVLKNERVKALELYNKTLAKKYMKLNKAVYNSLNYERKKLDILLRDKRPIAEIKGDKPVTVADLTEALNNKLYHGADVARGGKKMNEKKRDVLEEIFARRILKGEALRQGIDRTDLFKNRVKEYRNSLIFDTFVQKAVMPDIKLTAEEMKEYYKSHTKDFSYPEMMRIKTLAFVKKENAESARDKLLKGADFQWLSDNAEGRVDRTKTDLINMGGEIVIVPDLPEDIRKAVEGAHSDNARLYHPKDGPFYLFYIPEVIPPKPQSYDEVQELIAKKLYNEKLNSTVEEWAKKLRKASDVKVYVTDFK